MTPESDFLPSGHFGGVGMPQRAMTSSLPASVPVIVCQAERVADPSATDSAHAAGDNIKEHQKIQRGMNCAPQLAISTRDLPAELGQTP